MHPRRRGAAGWETDGTHPCRGPTTPIASGSCRSRRRSETWSTGRRRARGFRFGTSGCPRVQGRFCLAGWQPPDGIGIASGGWRWPSLGTPISVQSAVAATARASVPVLCHDTVYPLQDAVARYWLAVADPAMTRLTTRRRKESRGTGDREAPVMSTRAAAPERQVRRTVSRPE